jgi:hypothetical protein
MKSPNIHWLFAATLLIVGFLSLAASGFAQKSSPQTQQQETFLPLALGTYWVYAGTVTWADAEADQMRDVTNKVSMTMRVEKVFHKPEFTLAVISGYPGDLDWSNGQATPKPSLLIETRQHEVFLNTLPPDFDYAKLEKDAASLERFLARENLLFRWPLKTGMKFGDAESVNRGDGKYCWAVTRQEKKNLSGIKGTSSPDAEAFLLRYLTNPDETQLEVSPGVGILSYEYHHHGTTADTSVSLVEFHRGGTTPEADGAHP